MIKTMTEPIERKAPRFGMKPGFSLGVLFAISVIYARQDWLGLEKYVEICRATWIPTSWWLWATLAAVFIVASCERKQ
jgi:hypothetical protein